MTCQRPHGRFGIYWLYYHLSQKTTYGRYNLQWDFIVSTAHLLD